jgi:hypothetical protein
MVEMLVENRARPIIGQVSVPPARKYSRPPAAIPRRLR